MPNVLIETKPIVSRRSTFNRPDRRNALTIDSCSELTDAVERGADGNPSNAS